MRAKKRLRLEEVDNHNTLKAVSKRVDRIKRKLSSAEHGLSLAQSLEDQVVHVNAVEGQGKEIFVKSGNSKRRKLSFVLSEEKKKSRASKPSSLLRDCLNLSARDAERRCHETLEAANVIHGGSNRNLNPSLDGLYDTLMKNCPVSTLKQYVQSSQIMTKSVLPKIYEDAKENFESSPENVRRSIAIYYSGGIIGKEKWRSIRKSLVHKSNQGKDPTEIMEGCQLPKLLSYEKLMKQIKRIDIGPVVDVKTLVSDLDEELQPEGCYRELEWFLKRLAIFYFAVNKTRSDKLKWVTDKKAVFKVSIGADGTPFGSDDSACSWLLNFLNVKERVGSRDENFLIFGANCDEQDETVKRYALKLTKDIAFIEPKVYDICGVRTTFEFCEFPFDMKMLAFVAGELSNSAKYFSSFANVNKDNCNDRPGKVGLGPDFKWQPWKYDERLKVAKKVVDFKSSLKKKSYSKSTYRSKVTDFISKNHSRQEYEPLLGPLVDKAKVDPLHVKNNAFQQAFHDILIDAISFSALSTNVKKIQDVPDSCCFAKLMATLKYPVRATVLAKAIKKWFDDNDGKCKSFNRRFKGKQSRQLCHNFHHVVRTLHLLIDLQRNDYLKQPCTHFSSPNCGMQPLFSQECKLLKIK